MEHDPSLTNLEKPVKTPAGFLYLLRQINLEITEGDFLNREGTTIVQVTHNEAWAAYANRILRLKDGWMDGAK